MVIPKTVPPVLPSFLIKLGPPQQTHNNSPTQPNIMHKPILSAFIRCVKELRSLHRSSPATELVSDIEVHSEACCAEGVAFGFKATAGVEDVFAAVLGGMLGCVGRGGERRTYGVVARFN